MEIMQRYGILKYFIWLTNILRSYQFLRRKKICISRFLLYYGSVSWDIEEYTIKLKKQIVNHSKYIVYLSNIVRITSLNICDSLIFRISPRMRHEIIDNFAKRIWIPFKNILYFTISYSIFIYYFLRQLFFQLNCIKIGHF